MTSFRCPHCDKWLRAQESYLPRDTVCAHCRETITVPAQPSLSLPRAIVQLVAAVWHFVVALSAAFWFLLFAVLLGSFSIAILKGVFK